MGKGRAGQGDTSIYGHQPLLPKVRERLEGLVVIIIVVLIVMATTHSSASPGRHVVARARAGCFLLPPPPHVLEGLVYDKRDLLCDTHMMKNPPKYGEPSTIIRVTQLYPELP